MLVDGGWLSVISFAAFAQLPMHVLTAVANMSRLTIPMAELKHTLQVKLVEFRPGFRRIADCELVK